MLTSSYHSLWISVQTSEFGREFGSVNEIFFSAVLDGSFPVCSGRVHGVVSSVFPCHDNFNLSYRFRAERARVREILYFAWRRRHLFSRPQTLACRRRFEKSPCPLRETVTARSETVPPRFTGRKKNKNDLTEQCSYVHVARGVDVDAYLRVQRSGAF